MCCVTQSWVTCSLHADELPPLSYNKDIRPILSENCFYCHGFDEKHRQADLRLDVSTAAFADRDGYFAIVPNDPQASQVIARIEADDPDLLMPPPTSHRVLSAQQRQLIHEWIAQGAKYDSHWAFQAPVKIDLSTTADAAEATTTDTLSDPPRALSSTNPIDQLLQRDWLARGVTPADRTSPEKWLRRMSLDVTGLAPSPAELEEFRQQVEANGEVAFDEAVDRALASPRYGERMAQDWLDVARYADTHGFNNDSTRSMWRWRDWVIDAYNNNLPYDQFITKQLAGDLLPNPTLDDLIATGFCRNHGINSEGGIIGEEYRVEYVVDRVRTLGTGILGLTLECAKCHDHKFDPVTQKDFYSLFAFFNQVDEVGEDGRDKNAFPLVQTPTQSQLQSIAEMDRSIALASERLVAIEADVLPTSAELLNKPLTSIAVSPDASSNLTPAEDSIPLRIQGAVLVNDTPYGKSFALQDAESSIEWELVDAIATPSKAWTFTTWMRWNGAPAIVVSSMNRTDDPSSSGYGRGLAIEVTENGNVTVQLGSRWPAYAMQAQSLSAMEADQWCHLLVSFDGSGSALGLTVAINGEQALMRTLIDGFNSRDSIRHPAPPRLASEQGPDSRWSNIPFANPRWYAAAVDASQLVDSIDQQRMAGLMQLSEDSPVRIRNAVQLHLRSNSSPLANAEYQQVWQTREALVRDKAALMRNVPTTMVMQDNATSRETFVLLRGQYQSPQEKVTPDVPAAISLPWPDNAPRNRLGLAQWLTQPNHPLTSRVAVNRVWQQLFGTGLVKSSEDLGYQGEYPAHPELLDWLACEFVESGWDTKKLIKQIVLSETYRQRSDNHGELTTLDPENRMLARGPRYRLPAESLRDHLLNVGGLLRHRTGGPSVYPWQPEDLYRGIVVDAPYEGTKWGTSEGDDLFRRSVYTFWKRTVPFPVLNIFDAPDREFCVARRVITNTPLQSLVLMNEPAMLEAARGLAERMMQAGSSDQGPDSSLALQYGFVAATGRKATSEELLVLEESHRALTESFIEEPEQACQLLKEQVPTIDSATRAAWVAVASMIMNLDETMTKD